MAYLFALTLASAFSSPQALQQFDQFCSNLHSFEAVTSRISEAGWTQFTPAEASPLSAKLAILGSFRSAVGKKTAADYRTYFSPDFVDVTLLVMRRSHGSDTTLDCELNWGSAEEQVPRAELEEWASRDLDEAAKRDDLDTLWWRPGLRETHTSTGVVFVSQQKTESFDFLVPGLTITGRSETKSN